MCIILLLFRYEGLNGFYKGLIPGVLRVTPACCITFVVYENTITLLMEKTRWGTSTRVVTVIIISAKWTKWMAEIMRSFDVCLSVCLFPEECASERFLKILCSFPIYYAYFMRIILLLFRYEGLNGFCKGLIPGAWLQENLTISLKIISSSVTSLS